MGTPALLQDHPGQVTSAAPAEPVPVAFLGRTSTLVMQDPVASPHQQLSEGIPRDGGMAALLADAIGPVPRFAAVMCEDIERSGRDTFNALKLERQLGDAGIPLFATDEPINVEGM